MKALIIHGFSAKNLGDGLLVEESIDILQKAFGENIDITLATQYPETFNISGITYLRSGPNKSGYSLPYLKALRNINSYDFILAVGGGYMRFGYPLEAVKTGLVHGPQLLAASLAKVPSVYLPQSIGPLRGGSKNIVRHFLKDINRIYLRDARSVEEVNLPNVVRFPDLAALDVNREEARDYSQVDETPILQIRSIRGKVPAGIYTVEEMLGDFDSYIQSKTGGNNDVPATETLKYKRIVSKEELLEAYSKPRVIVAMRLHAALMALRAGHYVIHLSYERKGFGAFDDLGLSDYVYNVNNFDPSQVVAQAQELLNSEDARRAYDNIIRKTYVDRSRAKQRLIEDISNMRSA